MMAWNQCPEEWTIHCKHRAEKERVSLKKANRLCSKEAGLPMRTTEKWIWPNKKNVPISGVEKPNNFETCAISDLQRLIDGDKKFGTIYADPPWKYSNQTTRASTDNHYETMIPDEIAKIPISQLTEDKAHLHLWTTNAFLFECPKILEAWGFEYKGVFIWCKNQIGIGNYWRVSHEFLILGIKGNLTFYDKSQKSWLLTDRTKHSVKPDIVAETIEKVSPGPYLELFARRSRQNWTVWGNEIERTLFNEQAFKD